MVHSTRCRCVGCVSGRRTNEPPSGPQEAIPGDILASAVGDESLEDSCATGPPSVSLRAKVSDLYDALYQDGSSAEGWTVEAADILLLGHSERDKRGEHHRGGGRIGPGVGTKRGGLWRRAVD